MNDTINTPLAAIEQTMLSQAVTGTLAVASTSSPAPASSEGIETSVPCIQVSDSQMYKGGLCYHIELYAPACLDCTHLVDHAEVEYKKCHFSMGNTSCPAQYLRVTFIGQRVKWKNRIDKMEAMEKGPDKANMKLAIIDKAREIDEEDLRNYVMELLGF